jgi:hypothetical protein
MLFAYAFGHAKPVILSREKGGMLYAVPALAEGWTADD